MRATATVTTLLALAPSAFAKINTYHLKIQNLLAADDDPSLPTQYFEVSSLLGYLQLLSSTDVNTLASYRPLQ
jgi:hypothetical protein